MNYPKYHGNYLGIIVQNNDPQKRGRVKVFVPHVSPTVYKKWNEVAKDKKFRFLGANVCSDLTEILEDLKKILPWAELATPLMGESASGRYNAHLNAATISDSNDVSTAFSSITSFGPSTDTEQYSQNQDNIGEKPGNIFDISYYKLKDAFSNPSESGVNNVNIFSYNYTPECYSNCAKGSFPLLRVGSHVWVFFNSGDPLSPVIFGTSYGSEDWKSIHDIPDTTIAALSAQSDEGIDYPGTYENISQQQNDTYDINTETYRNKYIINQKGGTLSFVNTDNKEMLKLTHYSGSFKEFNNYTTIELATGNDQKLVLNDQFLTVRGYRNEYTDFDYDLTTRGDVYRKIGNQNRSAHQSWKDIYKDVADTKQLFEIQRSSGATGTGGVSLASSLQGKAGTPDDCPVCNKNINTYNVVNNSYDDNNFINKTNPTTSSSKGNQVFGNSVSLFGVIKSCLNPGNLGNTFRATPTQSLGNSADGSTGYNAPGYIHGVKCPFCKGTGKNPGSRGGSWNKDPKKQNLSELIKSKIRPLAAVEKEMGLGGSEIVEITKHKFETVGMVMNDYGSLRIDPEGKSNISDVRVGKFGTFYNRAATPLIEPVHVDDFPSGNYTLTVGNKYNILVGAGGVNLKSYGQVNISGGITTLAGSQVNIGSENEINIDGGKRISLVADVISIRQRKKKQVVVDGSLGVTTNLVVGGGLHAEGELTVNHITGPAEVHSTEEAYCFASPATDVGNGRGGIIGFGVPLYDLPIPVQEDGGTNFDPENIPGGEPAFIGVTDSTRVVGQIGLGPPIIIGYIPPDSVVTEVIAGVGIKNLLAIPIYGGIPAELDPTGLPVNTAPSPCVFGTDDLGLSNVRGAYGAGPLAPEIINNTSAKFMPIVIYGTGADPDSLLVSKHSHLFKTIASTLTETNKQARDAMRNAGDVAVPAQPVSNAPNGASSGATDDGSLSNDALP